MYSADINYKSDFSRLFHPVESYQSSAVIDENNDGIPEGRDNPYTFSNGSMNIAYTSSSDAFIQDGVVDNIGFNLPIDITWSQEDQEYHEEFTITLGNLVIHGETNGEFKCTIADYSYETNIYVGGSKVYYSSNRISTYGLGYGTVIARLPQYIIRHNNRVYYIIGNNSIYEGVDSSGLTGTLQLDYSFTSEVIIDENSSTPSQTIITFGAHGSNNVRDRIPIIWRPDKWQSFQEFQTFTGINIISDQSVDTITEIYQNDRNERDGCQQPSVIGMVEKGVTFPKCFPPIAIKFSGFKSNKSDNSGDNRLIIPGRITYDSSGQYPTYSIANINAEVQTQYQGMAGGSIRWANGATVSFDYTAVEGIIFNAISGNENTIVFEPMNPIDVMTNSQAYYGIIQGSEVPGENPNYYWLKGFFSDTKNYIESASDQFISLDFKNCRANPFETFDYTFKENGDYSYNPSPNYYGNYAGTTDNGFQLNNITLTVFKGVVAPTIHVSIAPLGKFNFVFESCEPYLSQVDIDNYANDHWPRIVELKRTGEIDSVTTVGIASGVTYTTKVLDANFADFTIDSSKRDNRPVFVLQYADLAGNPSDKSFNYKVRDKYGAESTGTVYIHFDSSAPSVVTKFFASETTTFTGLDYDLVCKVTAEPSMYTTTSPAQASNSHIIGDLIELYYVYPGKQLEATDLINTQASNKAQYHSFQNTIVHNFSTNQNITYPSWISWGGIKQDTIYAEFVSPHNHTPAMNRYGIYNEYTSSGTPEPRTVDHCVLSVSMHEGTEDYTGYITWDAVQNSDSVPVVDGVYIYPDPITEVECTPIDSDPIYRGVGHFLVYTDVSVSPPNKIFVDVPLGASPLIPYSLLGGMASASGPGNYWYERITRITDNTVPVIIGIRIDAVTVHYKDGSQETVYLSAWNDTGDPYIK